LNLRAQAEADLSFTVEDSVNGGGWNMVLNSPAGVAYPIVGISDNIGRAIDPQTGQIVTGSLVNVTLRLASLTTSGVPFGVTNLTAVPWTVTISNLRGTSTKWKVLRSATDETLGVIVLTLGTHKQVVPIGN